MTLLFNMESMIECRMHYIAFVCEVETALVDFGGLQWPLN